ncbi:MAG TPA: glycosyltransferase family 4 protein, partial [Thermoanaerobaculia bacterium]|nr:glycosyltransferase family 4 protein [Thermoanaerobaculia bacterium]
MRILQLCPRVPWPPNDGGRVAMLEITRGLAGQGVEVEVLSLDPAKHRGDAAAAQRALAPVPLDTVAIDTSAFLHAALAARRLDVPWLVARFWSPELVRRIAARLGERRYDVVHLESPFLLPYVGAIRGASRAPIALRLQNVEFRIWEHLAAREPRGVRRAVLARLAASLRHWEIAHLEDADALLPISRQDEADLRALGATRPSLILPCGIDVAALPPSQAGGGDPLALYFVGSMLYRPNLEAVEWILERLWPRLVAREPRIRLTVAGSAFPRPLRERLESAGIATAADVADLTAFAAPFGAMIAPLFSGSGMRIKVLGAMALGKPVIATRLGVGGIEVTPGEDALVADDPVAFAEAVIRCVRDRAL